MRTSAADQHMADLSHDEIHCALPRESGAYRSPTTARFRA